MKGKIFKVVKVVAISEIVTLLPALIMALRFSYRVIEQWESTTNQYVGTNISLEEYLQMILTELRNSSGTFLLIAIGALIVGLVISYYSYFKKKEEVPAAQHDAVRI